MGINLEEMKSLPTIDEMLKKVMEEEVKKKEKEIFNKKVADGTLQLIKNTLFMLEMKKEIIFCSKKTRHCLLKNDDTRALLNEQLKVIVSEAIPDGEVYILTDKKLKEDIIKSKLGL